MSASRAERKASPLIDQGQPQSLECPQRNVPDPGVCSKPGLEQVLRTGTAAPLTPSGVVGNEEDLNIHAGL
jgi:hypothetical protein